MSASAVSYFLIIIGLSVPAVALLWGWEVVSEHFYARLFADACREIRAPGGAPDSASSSRMRLLSFIAMADKEVGGVEETGEVFYIAGEGERAPSGGTFSESFHDVRVEIGQDLRRVFLRGEEFSKALDGVNYLADYRHEGEFARRAPSDGISLDSDAAYSPRRRNRASRFVHAQSPTTRCEPSLHLQGLADSRHAPSAADSWGHRFGRPSRVRASTSPRLQQERGQCGRRAEPIE